MDDLLQRVGSTQIGAIGESLVAACLISSSKGRLSPFRPMADDDGVDILVLDKATGGCLPLQVKARTRPDGPRGQTVQFDVQTKNLSSTPKAHLLAILLDVQQLAIKRAWFIRSSQLIAVARRGSGKWIVVANPSLDSKDRFATFRCRDMAAVTTLICAGFDGMVSRAEP